MPVITGTNQNDMLSGTADADVMSGLGGRDYLSGAQGNDDLDGGDGDDLLTGGPGDDVLHGGAGDDSLNESEGENDSLHGDGGNDNLSYNAMTTTAVLAAWLDGGEGDDFIRHYSPGTTNIAVILGGAGRDRILSSGGDSVRIDAGADADVVDVVLYQTDYDITLGTGADLLVVESNQFFDSNTFIRVRDFAAGENGDTLSLIYYLSRSADFWSLDANPFTAGYLRLVQQGADAVLEFDPDGTRTLYGFSALILFENMSAASLTVRNLGGYAPDGSVAQPLSVDGTALADAFTGAAGNDLLRGLGGDDVIYGGAGNDRIEGGDGADTLEGELGDDILYGGAGNDILNEVTAGNDQLFGEGGADSLFVDRQWFAVAATQSLLDGGDDDDRLHFIGRRTFDDATLRGGSGNDFITVATARSAIVEAGAGDDFVGYDLSSLATRITLGSGADTLQPYAFTHNVWPLVGATIMDFAPGDSGDRFYLLPLLSLTDWKAGENPFAGHDLRLLKDGADTLLLINPTGGGEDFVLVARLIGVDPILLTAANLEHDPLIAWTGSAGADRLSGTAAADELIGLGGDDVLAGGDGADRLAGGGGGDRLEGGAGADIFVYAAASESIAWRRSDGAKETPDVLVDFTSGQDRIDLSAIDAVAGTAGDDAFAFIGGAAFSRHAGELRFELVDGRVLIQADVDGDGSADLQILSLTPMIQAADFIL